MPMRAEMKKVELAVGKVVVTRERVLDHLKARRVALPVQGPWEQQTLEIEERLYPCWLAVVTAYADRRPFSPKRHVYPLYIDALSGKNFLIKRLPPTISREVRDQGRLIDPVVSEQQARQYVEELKEKQIKGLYIFKKPKEFSVEMKMTFRPVWEVRHSGGVVRINQFSGEVE